MQAIIALLLIAGVSAVLKDYMLASAALLLVGVCLVRYAPVTAMLQKHSFHVGIFFLMVFLLFPLTNSKVDILGTVKQLITPLGIFAILMGFAISYIGGKGVGVLSTQPVVLFGVLLGTLVAVLLVKGLPAGLIIAAGMVALIQLATPS
ncbi:Uncharacterized membrane protein, DUF441 family [Marininema mesophilum]|uniref:Uncharacterized membrane protein, DUF441 family n=1 Tax=Marininema mesophilum TaxID=1048340 RepID=A0A1H2ZWV2_9BACL|nr:DUF441 family protein [Marininema mesophilum]SDX21807.1 Uncharacterized membrane protein, DUF441 family [Marininema mesophilum]